MIKYCRILYYTILFYFHLCIYMCVCLHICKRLWRPEQGVGSPAAVVTGDCEPSTWVLGTGPWVLCKKISTVEPSLQPQVGDVLSLQMTIPNKKGVKSTAQGTARIPARCSSWPEGWISSLAALGWERCERATLLMLMKVPGVLMEGQPRHTKVNVQILNPENKNLGCVCVCMQVYVCMYVWMYDYVIIFKYVCACLWVYMYMCIYVYVYDGQITNKKNQSPKLRNCSVSHMHFDLQAWWQHLTQETALLSATVWSIFSISLQVCVSFAPSPTFWTVNEQAFWNHWGQLSA